MLEELLLRVWPYLAQSSSKGGLRGWISVSLSPGHTNIRSSAGDRRFNSFFIYGVVPSLCFPVISPLACHMNTKVYYHEFLGLGYVHKEIGNC